MQDITVGPIPTQQGFGINHARNNAASELVIVVGAGITGLATAWFLQRQGYEVLVLEASSVLGGNVQTVTGDGYQFERGPNSFINNRPAMQELIDGLALYEDLLLANTTANKRFVAKQGRLLPLPMDALSVLKTPVLSWQGKLRLLLEPFIGKAKGEQSIAMFVRRRLGEDAFDWLVDPFVSGVFAGDPERLSVAAALPRLQALETQYGSLSRGGWAKQRAKTQRVKKQRAKQLEQPATVSSDQRYHNKMLSLKGGMHQLMTRLAEGLINPVQLNVEVDKVTYSQHSGYLVQSGDAFWQTQKLVLALPAMQIARLMEDLPPMANSTNKQPWQQAYNHLTSIEYPALASISMAFKKSQIAHPLDGFGALFPSKENRQTLGVLFPSSIFSERAPADEHLLTVFIGGARDAAALHMDASSRLELVLGELTPYLGITGNPLWHVESLWPASIPQYHLGHQQKIATIDQAFSHLDNLYVCGNWRDGVSLSDCVTNAKLLAKRIADAEQGQA